VRIVLEGSRGSAFWLSPECNWIELLQPLLLLQLKTGLATQDELIATRSVCDHALVQVPARATEGRGRTASDRGCVQDAGQLLPQLDPGRSLSSLRRFHRLARREAQFEMFKVGGELLPGCGYRVVRGDSKAEPFTAVLERALAPTTREGQNAPAQERTPV
jgi:hypothetical protein